MAATLFPWNYTSQATDVGNRWDYIDRDTQCAHHLWLCGPDGRDPRAPHRNYPIRLRDRPWVEMDMRAIPGSHRYVATAGPHHGHAFGTLVLIDLRVEDDAALAQVRRLTPDVPFPEGEADIRSSQVTSTDSLKSTRRSRPVTRSA
jgi:hypothetical protein